MQGDIIPAFRIGGTHALLIFLYVVVIFGSLHLAALEGLDSKHPTIAKLAKAWIALGF